MREFNSILAITDLSPASDAALSTAASLASAAGIPLHVVNGPAGRLSFREYVQMTFAPRAFMKRATQLLDAQVRRTTNTSGVTQEVHVDSFSELLIQLAHEKSVGLIVLSRSLNADAIEAIVERSQLPTMVVDAKLRLPVRQVVMPITSAAPNQHALAEAKSWVYRLAAPSHSVADLEVIQVTHPAKQIRRIANRDDVDLIVTTLRPTRRGAIHARLTGSKRALLRSSKAPVLIIPGIGKRSLTAV
jgi:nucleotide-binding universal stress UspA family protein